MRIKMGRLVVIPHRFSQNLLRESVLPESFRLLSLIGSLKTGNYYFHCRHLPTLLSLIGSLKTVHWTGNLMSNAVVVIPHRFSQNVEWFMTTVIPSSVVIPHRFSQNQFLMSALDQPTLVVVIPHRFSQNPSDSQLY